MKVIEKVSEMKEFIRMKKEERKTIGFVPTMGYLHEGHLSLIRESVKQNDVSVVSIFVNPTQFGQNEDFDRYPRDIERDVDLLQKAGADVVFIPAVGEIYPEGFKTFVSVEELSNVMCGKTRKGHFKGVCTVVNILLNIVKPDRAYFGQKDAQQVIIIKKMVKDLRMDVDICVCPIVREEDGLAMSSRNVYLSAKERKAATIIPRCMLEARDMIINGERDKNKIVKYLTDGMSSEGLVEVEYVEIVNSNDLSPIERIKGNVLVAVAVRIGSTRLIDNFMLEVE